MSDAERVGCLITGACVSVIVSLPVMAIGIVVLIVMKVS